ncbi:hypothetical protein GCM10007874_08450 [Labrys miyagiensis]|uniref:LysR substrate binding domain-containing protein n=1 Tax=Labrys miyagiensis TaxID=346912 RepID=A0ABQ6CG54_9HYPH|nr:hypothetical protein GCM10007874_08450 [Labrys miyagiensis]
MILLDPVVEVLAPADTNWFQRAAGSVQQPALAVTGNDGLPVCLAAINDNALRPAVAPAPLDVYISYAPSRQLSTKVQVFVDWVTELYRRIQIPTTPAAEEMLR